jgi:hypothetical protein
MAGGEDIPYPGILTLIPCLATAVIIFGSLPNPYINFRRILNNMILYFIGEISYSLYLIHWPMIIFIKAALDRPLQFKDKFLILNAMIVSASILYFLIEKRFRITNASTYRIGNIGKYYIRISLLPIAVGLILFSPQALGVQPHVLSPLDLSITESQDVAKEFKSPDSEANFRSSSKVFTLDEIKLVKKSAICLSKMSESRVLPCVYGSTEASASVVLWGDSHAAQWASGLDLLGKENDFKVTDFTKGGCPPAKLLVLTKFGKPYSECVIYRESALMRILQLKPNLVILSSLRTYSNSSSELDSGYEYILKPLNAAGIKVLLISDTPYPKTNVPECISLNLTNANRCDSLRAFSTDKGKFSKTLKKISNDNSADFVDPVPWMCDEIMCPAVIKDSIVYVDGSHMTKEFSIKLSAPLEKYILRNL